MARLLFDVDQTVVDPSRLWWAWLEGMTGFKQDFPVAAKGKVLSYDLSTYFTVGLKDTSIDPLDFWRGANIYDFLFPIEDAMETIWDLKLAGHTIMWASHCKGHHMGSKYRFLERWFPIDSFHATQEKHDIRCDLVVDDRVDVLNKFDKSVLKLLYDSPWGQKEVVQTRQYGVLDWEDAKKVITNIYKVNNS